MSGPDVAAEWLLTPGERGNPATTIDAEHEGGRAWTTGNLVRVHVDGAAYFARLHELLSTLGPGDWRARGWPCMTWRTSRAHRSTSMPRR